MKNRNVGFLITGISVVMAILVYIFNKGLKDIVSATCSHGPTCSMYTSISIQTWISLSITALVFLIGLFLIFSKEQEKIVFKRVQTSAKKKSINYNSLDKEEKVVIKAIEEAQGAMFQSSIVEKVGFDKVKVTRILDRLEGKQLIERRRRGMTNVVMLK